MARRKKIYEGKAKTLYEGPEPGTIIQYFKDDATAFNAEKKAVIEGKGVLNNMLSEYFMTGLNTIGVPTHFIKRLNMREQLVRAVEIIPLEVIVRNYAAGTMAKRLGIEEGTQLSRPIYDGDFQRLIVADEISPDSCRLWDIATGRKLDKDVFRRDLGSLTDAYTEVATRLGVMPKGSTPMARPKLIN